MALSSTPTNPDPIASGIGGIIDLIRGTTGYDADRARAAARVADPFMDERAGYQQQLHGLLTDPSTFKTDPGYEFALGQGQQAIERASNSKFGTSRVGGLGIDLAKYTEGFAAQNYDQRIQQLLTASGATTGSPATAGQLIAGGQQNQDKSLAGGIAGVTQLLESLFPGMGAQIAKSLGFGSGAGGGGVTNPVPSGSFTDPFGNVFDASGKQIGAMDQNGNMIPSYPTSSLDPRLGNLPDPSDVIGSSGGGTLSDPSDIINDPGFGNFSLPDPSDVIDGSGYDIGSIFSDLFGD